MTEERAAIFVELLPLILHLRRCGRHRHKELIDAICLLLCSGKGTPHLKMAMASGDSRLCQAALDLARTLEADELEVFFRAGLAHRILTIRYASFRELCSRLDATAIEELARECLLNPSGSVRREALLVILRNSPKDLESLLEVLLFDRNRTVRWTVIDQLTRRFARDPLQEIRAELAKEAPAHLEGALEAMGELGTRDDVSLLTRFLDSENSRIRATTIRTISRLDDTGSFDRIAAAIVDDSPRVSKAAREGLKRSSIPMIRQAIEGAMEPYRPPHLRRNALVLLLRLPPFDALEYALNYFDDPDDRVKNIARSQLGVSPKRLANSYDKPSEKQVRRILALLEAVPDAVSLRNGSHGCLKVWHRDFLSSFLLS